MRFYLGVPTGGSPAAPFVESLSHIVLPSGTIAFERGIVTGNFVPAQRDLLLERALEWNADVVAMCDDDMVVPPDGFAALCAALEADASAAIAGALYYSRDGLRPLVVDGWNDRDTRAGWIPAFDDRTPVAVDGVGFGCVAIRASAVRELERPFFSSHVYVERTAGRVRVCNEDYLFCARVREAGNSVLLHPGVRCGHYDRASNAVAPKFWEPPDTTSQRRILVREGESYRLVPFDAEAPHESGERHVRGAVTYVEVP
ncbi:MAG: glycosyltransferase [Candidatus Eremiobacteraeota bacterium]|nr:glycosyltransferase [Candidatus Eremiobacteraeota bacterium]MBV8655776.1 glycosyltransferase [Candidatus Eremiobacteraeota bacterium]